MYDQVLNPALLLWLCEFRNFELPNVSFHPSIIVWWMSNMLDELNSRTRCEREMAEPTRGRGTRGLERRAVMLRNGNVDM